jgi:ribose/xylose/arabinose/galactoside ABC-type transport system permease subunit
MTQTLVTERSGFAWRDFFRQYGALAFLLLLVGYNWIFTPNFAAEQTFWNLLLHVSTTTLVAVGMTLVIATAGIDLSVGAVMALAASTSTLLMGDGGMAVVVLGTLMIAAWFGALNGTVIATIGVQPIIITLASMIAGRGIAQVLTDGSLVSFQNPAFEYIGKGKVGPVPVPVLITFAAVVLIGFLVRHTVFGRSMEAIGDNEEAARLAGVKVRQTKILVYMLAAVLAAIAGMIETARLAAADATKIGLFIELDAIAAVVIGGTLLTGGRALIWGTVIGALIMQVVTTTFNYHNIPHAYALVLKAVIIILAILLQRERNG